METLDIFLPPKGFLLLALDDAEPAGCACSRTLGDRIAEMKRMYVRPSHRRKGIGAKLVQESIQRAKEQGFSEMRLDSAGFMHDAHRVYRSFGFEDIPPYDGSEIPEEYRKNWVFMRLRLK
jgi:GNAT superfamily N-acetyltransferase